jgi:hypothetical protein
MKVLPIEMKWGGFPLATGARPLDCSKPWEQAVAIDKKMSIPLNCHPVAMTSSWLALAHFRSVES